MQPCSVPLTSPLSLLGRLTARPLLIDNELNPHPPQKPCTTPADFTYFNICLYHSYLPARPAPVSQLSRPIVVTGNGQVSPEPSSPQALRCHWPSSSPLLCTCTTLYPSVVRASLHCSRLLAPGLAVQRFAALQLCSSALEFDVISAFLLLP